MANKGSVHDLSDERTINALRSIFTAAHEILRSGRLSSLIEGIRAETVAELLDQAKTLASGGYQVAAVVIAGGALETFLLHLCNRNKLTWQGDGSISKYEGALAQARNSGTEIISATDCKQVIAWGGIRNDAAHSPATFKRSEEQVDLMVEGIRQFIARYQ